MSWEALLPTASAIFVGAVMLYMQRAQSKRDKESDHRAEVRRKADYLQYRVNVANGDLTYEIANALEHNHVNGNVKAAMDRYNKEKAKYTNFMFEQLGEYMHDD